MAAVPVPLAALGVPFAAVIAIAVARALHTRRHARQIARARAKDDVLRKELEGQDEVAARLAGLLIRETGLIEMFTPRWSARS